MIHCIGDSHSNFFSGIDEMQPGYPKICNNILPYFKSYRIGAATAYKLENKVEIIDTIIYENHNFGDYIMFVFGEVDCRLHLGINNNTEECVNKYFNFIKLYKKHNIIVCGPIASSPDHLVKGNIPPHVGNCIERNERTKKFNSLLKNKCDDANILFITIFDIMLLEDGNTNEDYLMDHIHLSQKSMPIMVQRLKNMGVIND